MNKDLKGLVGFQIVPCIMICCNTVKEFKDLYVGTDSSMFLNNCHQNLGLLIRGKCNVVKVQSFHKFRFIIRLTFSTKYSIVKTYY